MMLAQKEKKEINVATLRVCALMKKADGIQKKMDGLHRLPLSDEAVGCEGKACRNEKKTCGEEAYAIARTEVIKPILCSMSNLGLLRELDQESILYYVARRLMEDMGKMHVLSLLPGRHFRKARKIVKRVGMPVVGYQMRREFMELYDCSPAEAIRCPID